MESRAAFDRLASPPCPNPRVEAMPRKRKGSPAPPVPQESAEWQGPSHERLSARAVEREHASTGVSRETFVELATLPLGQIAQHGVLAGPAQDDVRRTPSQVAQYLHRHSLEGQLPVGFEPQRHTVVICGRPVQVSAGKCFKISPLFFCGPTSALVGQ